MITWILNLLRSLFSGGSNAKTEAARVKQQESLAHVESSGQGLISCPFQLEVGYSCKFNKTSNSFHCDDCKRSGSMKTLLDRLHAAGVYTESVS